MKTLAANSTSSIRAVKTALQARLTACAVTPLIYQFDPMELDGPAKAKAAIDEFAPDARLQIQHTLRRLYNGEERGENYVLTLYDNTEHRDVWKATIVIASASRLVTDRSHAGADLATRIVRQMSSDGVLKSCPVKPEDNLS